MTTDALSVRVLQMADVAEARARMLAAADQAGLSAERTDDALVVLCELVANALLHGHGVVEVTFTATPSRLLVSVADGSPTTPEFDRPMPGPDSIGGRGIPLCSELASKLWVKVHSNGKAIHAEIS